jgi:hypothetical protein
MILMNENSYENINDVLKKGYPYRRKEIFSLIEKVKPQYTAASFRWILDDLLKRGTLKRFGRGLYMKGCEQETYMPEVLPLERRAVKILLERFPLAKIVAFSSTILNEWLNELVAHGTIVVEMEESYLDDAYYLLKEKTKATVLLKPTEKEITHYRDDDTIILEPLRSRAPLLRKDTTIKLEKLMVDLLADSFLTYFFSPSELPALYKTMNERYIINKDALYAYATRRGVCQELISLLPKQ